MARQSRLAGKVKKARTKAFGKQLPKMGPVGAYDKVFRDHKTGGSRKSKQRLAGKLVKSAKRAGGNYKWGSPKNWGK